MGHGKEWSPRKYSSAEIADVLVDMIESNIDNQRVLTKYTGDAEGFHQHVANRLWDPYTYKLIGENTGCLYTAIDIAAALELKLPEKAVERAQMYAYPS